MTNTNYVLVLLNHVAVPVKIDNYFSWFETPEI